MEAANKKNRWMVWKVEWEDGEEGERRESGAGKKEKKGLWRRE